jgi:hypothetical protein
MMKEDKVPVLEGLCVVNPLTVRVVAGKRVLSVVPLGSMTVETHATPWRALLDVQL